jgi:hypothetical protein
VPWSLVTAAATPSPLLKVIAASNPPPLSQNPVGLGVDFARSTSKLAATSVEKAEAPVAFVLCCDQAVVPANMHAPASSAFPKLDLCI